MKGYLSVYFNPFLSEGTRGGRFFGAKKFEVEELLRGFSEAKTLLWPAFNYLCPDLHPEESICN